MYTRGSKLNKKLLEDRKSKTQKVWLHQRYNKHQRPKSKHVNRYTAHRKRTPNNSGGVFNDPSVPSLHDLTLKIRKMYNDVTGSVGSFNDTTKPFKVINYKRIHNRWKNKKYRRIQYGGEGENDVVVTTAGEAVADAAAPAEAVADAPAEAAVPETEASCLDSKAPRKFEAIENVSEDGKNVTFTITETKPETFEAVMKRLMDEGSAITTIPNSNSSSGSSSKSGISVGSNTDNAAAAINSCSNNVGTNTDNPVTDAVIAAASADASPEDNTYIIEMLGVFGKPTPAAAAAEAATSVSVASPPKILSLKENPAAHRKTEELIIAAAAAAAVAAAAAAAASADAAAVDPSNTVVLARSTDPATKDSSTQMSSRTPVAASTANTASQADHEENEDLLLAAAAAAAAAASATDLPQQGDSPVEAPKTPDYTDLIAKWDKIHGSYNDVNAYKSELEKTYKEAIKASSKDGKTDTNISNVDNSITIKNLYEALKDNSSSKSIALKLINNDENSAALNKELLEWLDWISENMGGKVRVFIAPRYDLGTPDASVIKNENRLALSAPDGNGKIKLEGGNEAEHTYGKFYKVWTAMTTRTPAERNKDMANNYKDLNIMSKIMSGNNVGLFGYGYSGSGKTYNLIGNYPVKDEHTAVLGLIPLFIKEILNTHNIRLNVFEIYGRGYPQSTTTCTELKFEPTFRFTYTYFETNKRIITAKEDSKWETETYNIIIRDDRHFCDITHQIDQIRKRAQRVTYTINNDKSSRGHLFYYFTFTSKGKDKNPLGNLLVCDMGGRENPQEISETTLIDTVSGFLCKLKSPGIYEYINQTEINDKKIVYPKTKPLEQNVYRIFDYATKDKNKKILIKNNFAAYLSKHGSSEIFPPSDIVDQFRKPQIINSVQHVIDRCKEGFFINETINHLVVYINYLSFKDSFDDGPNALKLANTTRNICPIHTDKNNVYTYFPNVCASSHDPLKIIFSSIDHELERKRYFDLYANRPYVETFKKAYTNTSDKKQATHDNGFDKVGDLFGIITLLRRIKTPGKSKYYSILSTVACVMLQEQNEGEVRKTLEFAQSISASGDEPNKYKPESIKIVGETKPRERDAYMGPTTSSKAKSKFADTVRKKPVEKVKIKGGSNNKTRKNKKGLL